MTEPGLLNRSSVSGKVYQVWSTNLSVPFTAFGSCVTASAPLLTITNSPASPAQYYNYKIQLIH